MRLSKSWSKSLLMASVLLLTTAADAQTLIPRPTPQPNKSPHLAERERQQYPSPIRTPYLSHAPNNTGATANEEQHSSDASTVIILFTAISAIATAFIAWFNFQLVGVTDEMKKATAEAAEAAKQSAKVAELAFKTERPYLLIEEVKIIGITPPPPQNGLANRTQSGEERDPVICTLRFRNFGRGTARVIKIYGRVTIQANWPQQNVEGSHTQKIEKEAVAALDSISFQMIRDPAESLYLTRAEFDSMDDGSGKLIAYGALLYADVTGAQVYYTNFAWHFAPWLPILRMFKTQTTEWRGQGETQRGPESLNKHT